MAQSQELNVLKRNGECEEMSFDKILKRIKTLGKEADIIINYSALVIKIIDQLYDNINTSEIDELTAQQCASLITKHPDYGTLASRILISNHHKNTENDFKSVIDKLYNFKDVNGKTTHLISDELYNVVTDNSKIIQCQFDFERDYDIDYFGFKTLERAYLMKVNGHIVERPQHMWMRVALGIHGDNLSNAFKTYEYMSKKYFTHATPTLFNSGTPRPQLSSCYLLSMEEDSIKGIYNTLGECASISKWAGGIGLHIHNIRSEGSHIRGTNGTSNGIVPMLRVFNNTARYVDQGGGRRNGSFAMYLEPWHGDIENFLEMKKNHGDEEIKARDLFYALWVPDLFMKRVKENKDWTLMCPDKCPGLSDVYGEQFENKYEEYEKLNKGNKTIKARDLWLKILDSQIETGTPYLLYKDAANKKSNQSNLGTIKSSNLCCEIMEYSSENETAVCNLASIGLPMFVENKDTSFIKNVTVYGKKECIYCDIAKKTLKNREIQYEYIDISDDVERKALYDKINNTYTLLKPVNSVPIIFINDKYIGGTEDLLKILQPTFNFEKLHEVTKVVANNLNTVIDVNFYPTEKTRISNLKHRPIGIGVQGLADVFAMMNYPFCSPESEKLNEQIFETIYHASCEKSMEISKERCKDMIYIKECFNNNLFTFDVKSIQNKHEIQVCNKYIIYENNVELKKILDKHKPIYAEVSSSSNYNGAYSSFEHSPASKKQLQFDLWNTFPSNKYDWETLKNNISKYGMRNSLLVAPMPTASTSQILGNNECFEPFTSNIYIRRTLAGEFVIINKHLMRELTDLNLWNDDVKNNIIYNKGSIQHLKELPKFIREKYKIVWEMPMKNIIDMATTRGKYICQSQSMNLWMENPTYDKITSMHFYAWSKGLKTGLYYLRTKAKASAQQFTIDPSKIKKYQVNQNNQDNQDEQECLMCSG